MRGGDNKDEIRYNIIVLFARLVRSESPRMPTQMLAFAFKGKTSFALKNSYEFFAFSGSTLKGISLMQNQSNFA